MTTFYRHDRTLVTEEWLTVGERRYAIDDLHNLRIARGRGDPVALRAAVAAAAVGALALLAAVAGILPVAAVAAVGALAALPLGVTAAARARLRPRPYLLWADVRGSTVQVYRSGNRTEFGKLSRAVARAVARARTHRRTDARYVVILRRV